MAYFGTQIDRSRRQKRKRDRAACRSLVISLHLFGASIMRAYGRGRGGVEEGLKTRPSSRIRPPARPRDYRIYVNNSRRIGQVLLPNDSVVVLAGFKVDGLVTPERPIPGCLCKGSPPSPPFPSPTPPPLYSSLFPRDLVVIPVHPRYPSVPSPFVIIIHTIVTQLFGCL